MSQVLPIIAVVLLAFFTLIIMRKNFAVGG